MALALARSAIAGRCLQAFCRPAIAVPSRGFFGNAAAVGPHSKVLGDSNNDIFEMQVHNIKPECMGEYRKLVSEKMSELSSREDIPVKLLASWTVSIGPVQDQAVHIWSYADYDEVTEARQKMNSDEAWGKFREARNKLLVSRSNQIIMAFTYWKPKFDIKLQNIYELRSYTLKPGTLIEWGQAWQKGILHRGEDEAVGGWFSQIGVIHQVHHLWAYKDLKERKEMRQMSWENPGWDECVRKTVPLIRHMESKILTPLN